MTQAVQDFYAQYKALDKPLTLLANLYSVPKGRPRASANGHMYTPQNTRAFEEQIRTLALTKGWVPYLCPVFIRVSITVAIPVSYSAVQKLMAEQLMITPPRGDLDNRVKAITDALNKVAYYDDVQITRVVAEKVFGISDQISVTVSRAGLSDLEIDRFKKSQKVSNGKRNNRGSNTVG